MILSSLPTNKYYKGDHKFYHVFLDGNLLHHFTFANEEKGFVSVYKVDKHGDLVVRGGNLIQKLLYGQVEIVRKETHWDKTK